MSATAKAVLLVLFMFALGVAVGAGLVAWFLYRPMGERAEELQRLADQYHRDLTASQQHLSDLGERLGEAESIGERLGRELAESRTEVGRIRGELGASRAEVERLRDIAAGIGGSLDESTGRVREAQGLILTAVQRLRQLQGRGAEADSGP